MAQTPPDGATGQGSDADMPRTGIPCPYVCPDSISAPLVHTPAPLPLPRCNAAGYPGSEAAPARPADRACSALSPSGTMPLGGRTPVSCPGPGRIGRRWPGVHTKCVTGTTPASGLSKVQVSALDAVNRRSNRSLGAQNVPPPALDAPHFTLLGLAVLIGQACSAPSALSRAHAHRRIWGRGAP